MEDKEGNITTRPEIHDFSQPGGLTGYFQLLLENSLDMGGDDKSRAIARILERKARAIEPNYYPKVSPLSDKIKEKASQMQNIGNIDWSSPKK